MSNKTFDRKRNAPTPAAGARDSGYIEKDIMKKDVAANGIDRRRRRFLLSSVGSAVAGPIALNVAFGEARAGPLFQAGPGEIRTGYRPGHLPASRYRSCLGLNGAAKPLLSAAGE